MIIGSIEKYCMFEKNIYYYDMVNENCEYFIKKYYNTLLDLVLTPFDYIHVIFGLIFNVIIIILQIIYHLFIFLYNIVDKEIQKNVDSII